MIQADPDSTNLLMLMLVQIYWTSNLLLIQQAQAQAETRPSNVIHGSQTLAGYVQRMCSAFHGNSKPSQLDMMHY